MPWPCASQSSGKFRELLLIAASVRYFTHLYAKLHGPQSRSPSLSRFYSAPETTTKLVNTAWIATKVHSLYFIALSTSLHVCFTIVTPKTVRQILALHMTHNPLCFIIWKPSFVSSHTCMALVRK